MVTVTTNHLRSTVANIESLRNEMDEISIFSTGEKCSTLSIAIKVKKEHLYISLLSLPSPLISTRQIIQRKKTLKERTKQSEPRHKERFLYRQRHTDRYHQSLERKRELQKNPRDREPSVQTRKMVTNNTEQKNVFIETVPYEETQRQEKEKEKRRLTRRFCEAPFGGYPEHPAILYK